MGRWIDGGIYHSIHHVTCVTVIGEIHMKGSRNLHGKRDRNTILPLSALSARQIVRLYDINKTKECSSEFCKDGVFILCEK